MPAAECKYRVSGNRVVEQAVTDAGVGLSYGGFDEVEEVELLFAAADNMLGLCRELVARGTDVNRIITTYDLRTRDVYLAEVAVPVF